MDNRNFLVTILLYIFLIGAPLIYLYVRGRRYGEIAWVPGRILYKEKFSTIVVL